MASAKGADFDWEDHARGTIYGNAIGDAIGLLTEFMNKQEAQYHYGHLEQLELDHKMNDRHRIRFPAGDWTDDTDQMIIIMKHLLDNGGKVKPVEFGAALMDWASHGFPELGDKGGMGIGATTKAVLHHEDYATNPHKAAAAIWKASRCQVAPNGGVMRTSVLGVHCYRDKSKVIKNTLNISKVTHADHRCQASCVAVTTAIAMMLKRSAKHVKADGSYDVEAIRQDAYERAKKCLPWAKRSMHQELKDHMFAENLSSLNLSDFGPMGYTYKCLGAGFWAFMQDDFRQALTTLTMEAGDADTNGAVAGALLGCKLGAKALPDSWLNGLKHKAWLDEMLSRFLEMQE